MLASNESNSRSDSHSTPNIDNEYGNDPNINTDEFKDDDEFLNSDKDNEALPNN